MTTFEAVLMVAICAVPTFATRVLAFVMFAKSGKTAGAGSPSGSGVEYLGRVLPCAITAMLVVYCLRNTHVSLPLTKAMSAELTLSALAPWLPELIATTVTAGVYLCLKKFDCGTIAAIAAGTAAYMVQVQVIFV